MFRSATYKPAICNCDVFREEADHQTRNAFSLYIYCSAIILIIPLFVGVYFLRDYADIQQPVYEPCNKTGIVAMDKLKDFKDNHRLFQNIANSMAESKKMMKNSLKGLTSLMGEEHMKEQEQKMDKEFYNPIMERANEGKNSLNAQIFLRKKCEEENLRGYLVYGVLRSLAALGIIGISLALFWFIHSFVISTNYIKSKFTADDYFIVYRRTHRIFVAAFIIMLAYAIGMYCRDFYLSIFVNTFEKVYNET